jgi:hypothetical protein
MGWHKKTKKVHYLFGITGFLVYLQQERYGLLHVGAFSMQVFGNSFVLF